MKTVTHNRGGYAYISILAAMLIGGVTFTAHLTSVVKEQRMMAESLQQAMAQGAATELLELFLSVSRFELARYLWRNPVNPLLPGYPLCSQINIVSRNDLNEEVKLNPDPLADLDPTFPLPTGSLGALPNRFYLLTVLDAGTLALKNDACGFVVTDNRSKPCGVTGTEYNLCAEDRLQVTVGVIYYPFKGDMPMRVALSAVLTK